MTWVDFISSCPAKGCNNGRSDIHWAHHGCDNSRESINEEGNIRCNKCNDIHFILNSKRYIKFISNFLSRRICYNIYFIIIFIFCVI